MLIKFYNNTSEKNVLSKTLTNEIIMTGWLREESDIHTPVVTIEGANITGYNYAFIPEFGRYYFITEITSVRTGFWRVSMACDVLMSFRTHILNSYGVIDHTQTTDISEYMRSDIWQTMVKDKTDILNFPNGLLDSGEYILITAGGNA